MKYNQIDQEQILLSMDIYEVMQLSKSLEDTTLTRETMETLYDLDQIIFAYYRELERRSSHGC